MHFASAPDLVLVIFLPPSHWIAREYLKTTIVDIKYLTYGHEF